MKKIAVIGGGPAGLMAAIASKELDATMDITIFEKSAPLKTILCTGGGRCNLSYADYDFKSLSSNYPRGEKFLYSAFSRFGVAETLEWLEVHGIKTYTQEDNRIFPITDSANDVRNSLLNLANKLHIKVEKNTTITHLLKKNDIFILKTAQNEEKFDKVIIATGGRYKNIECSGFDMAKNLGHTITDLKPALCGLKVNENWVKNLSGVSLRDINAEIYFNGKKQKEVSDDLLFTHEGISGPLSYKISSYCAFSGYNRKNPLVLKINLVQKDSQDFEQELLQKLDEMSKKSLINIIAEYLPKSFILELLKAFSIDSDKKASQISKNERKLLVKLLTSFELNVISPSDSGEIVTAGGVSPDEINPKTMESKLVKNLYFCGEVMNIDGLTGGFNLQACWSTGYIAGEACI